MQIYLVSIIANFIGGLCLIFRKKTETGNNFIGLLQSIIANRILQILVGLVALAAGILKFFIFTTPTGIPVLEDLLPALAGICAGGSLIYNSLRLQREPSSGSEAEAGEKKPLSIESAFTPVGIVAIIVAIAHFIFPGVIFL
jgi:hypothetical protein